MKVQLQKKFQTQLLINPKTRDRADALALVMNESRAEVLRQLIDRSLPAFERRFEEEMAEHLDPIAAALGMTRPELAAMMKREELTLADWNGLLGRFRD